jgi:transposase
MGKKQQVPNRQYADEFKTEAVRLAESIGGNQAVKRLGVPDSSMQNWVRLSRASKPQGGTRYTRPDQARSSRFGSG